MRSRISFIQARIRGNLEESGTEIVMQWNEYGSPDTDPVTGARIATPTQNQCTIRAFVHFVSASSVIRNFTEIETGDAILDLAPEVTLRNKDGLTFLLPTGESGCLEPWTNKPMSEHLARYWDAMAGGRKLYQTVLVRRAT
jgi:hypothetical protein